MNGMAIVNGMVVLASSIGILYIMLEGFEALVLPRRIERPLRFSVAFYRNTWKGWVWLSRHLSSERRDNFLAFFGPFSLLLLLNLWAIGLIVCFGAFHWAVHSPVIAPEKIPNFGTYLYLSGTTFITLGFGDVAPRSTFARILADIEAGVGFGFLAIVIGYLPVLYGAFSRREVEIALLDARASSPPSAGALLERIAVCPDLGDLTESLRSYERWAAELLESHLSYPVLMYYRSQHDRQSWLSALTSILDTCAILIAAMPDGKIAWQARMTFAISRHAAVDLSMALMARPTMPDPDRLPPLRWAELRANLEQAGLPLKPPHESDERLLELRQLYEPHVNALAKWLQLSLPAWQPNPDLPDNWQTSQWDRSDHFFQDTPRRAEQSRTWNLRR